MAKAKTSTADFARFLEESDEPAAFSETRAKVEPILSQSEAKVEPNAEFEQKKLEPKLSQKVEPTPSLKKKVEPQPEPKVEPILSQSEAKVEPTYSLDALVGLQRRSLFFIYDSCRKIGSKISAPISIQNLSADVETTVAAARKALQRLEQKGFIARLTYKDGRGGWTQYCLPERVYNALLISETRAKVEPKLSQTRAKVRTEVEPQPEPSAPSSSSRYLKLKEPTTTQENYVSHLDLSSVESAGITQSVILRCIDLYPEIQPEKLEDLVFRFGEFIKDPKNRVQNARGFFISLAEQLSKGQVPLDHIETPGERLMREFVERKKEAKAKAQEIEQAALEFEFEAWFEALTPEMKLKLVPETSMLRVNSAPHRAMLRGYFTEHVWPERRAQIQSPEATP